MLRARVVDKEGDDDGTNFHSQDADEFGGGIADWPREVKNDDRAQPETSTQQFTKTKKKKNKSRKKKKKNQSDSTNRDPTQNTESTEAHCTSSRELSVQQPINESANEKTNEDGPWSDLILDLVSILLQKLSYVDCLAATFAIPSWRQGVEKPLGPSLLSFANGNKAYTISSILHGFKTTVTCPDFPDNIKILASKHGWLLLMVEEEEEEEDRLPCLIFFYNPVSKAIIKLPPYNHARWDHFSFSAPPDSSNCVVIASNLIDNYRKLIICEKGRDEWIDLTHGNEYVEHYEECFTAEYMSPVFHKGRFYWIGVDGRVAEFDLLTRLLTIHGKDMRLWPSTFRFYLVESDVGLFSVWSTREGDTVRIYKLNLDNGPDIWKETFNLGGRCFFVGLKASISLTTRVLSCKEEKIYFMMVDQAKNFVYYSLNSSKMHPHGNFMGCSELFFNHCWFEPQWVEPKFQELNWF